MNNFRELVRQNEGPPVLIERIIRSLGIELNVKTDLQEGIDGVLERLRSGSYSISIHKDRNVFQRRFLIAHLLGHYMLHAHLIKDGVAEGPLKHQSESYNPKIGEREESDANRFAVELLLPRKLLILETITNQTLEDISNMFLVTQRAMEIRLTGLGYKIEDGMINK